MNISRIRTFVSVAVPLVMAAGFALLLRSLLYRILFRLICDPACIL